MPSKIAEYISVADTIEKLRQQFNNLVDLNQANNSLFVTPQQFATNNSHQKAISAGLVDATPYFSEAVSTGKAVYVPPGNYILTSNFEQNVFFSTGNVSVTGGGSLLITANLDPRGPTYKTNLSVTTLPTLEHHVTNRAFVTGIQNSLQTNINNLSSALNSEASQRASFDNGLQNQITDLSNLVNTNNVNVSDLLNVERSERITTDNNIISWVTNVQNTVIANNTTINSLLNNEVTARSGADSFLGSRIDQTNTRIDNLSSQVNTSPSLGSWWNDGYVRVRTDGSTEIGKYLDFHEATGPDDFSVRIESAPHIGAWAGKHDVVFQTANGGRFIFQGPTGRIFTYGVGDSIHCVDIDNALTTKKASSDIASYVFDVKFFNALTSRFNDAWDQHIVIKTDMVYCVGNNVDSIFNPDLEPWWNISYRYGLVAPPGGYSIDHCMFALASPAVISFSGGVNGDDSLWCTVGRVGNELRVTCGNSEQRIPGWATVISGWKK